ncbi:hypothetical protein COCVIDRAFT_19232 [Bipolaris victoriae FI3]|uniref:Uncharacterized protein n=1 Tax=Bipolaris victoriae (strain FI3) TaxID=930091 RepID=W7E7T2_BIPV3|nr:hypothetical protein COCVIDRAFT_19232 [Bipolaris victoriae FI3]
MPQRRIRLVLVRPPHKGLWLLDDYGVDGEGSQKVDLTSEGSNVKPRELLTYYHESSAPLRGLFPPTFAVSLPGFAAYPVARFDAVMACAAAGSAPMPSTPKPTPALKRNTPGNRNVSPDPSHGFSIFLHCGPSLVLRAARLGGPIFLRQVYQYHSRATHCRKISDPLRNRPESRHIVRKQ